MKLISETPTPNVPAPHHPPLCASSSSISSASFRSSTSSRLWCAAKYCRPSAPIRKLVG